ncbi:MAG: putative membrane protein YqiK [Candidatus Nanohaloarchaea archaeon]|jgi:uncharacterized membrane protein YqiK
MVENVDMQTFVQDMKDLINHLDREEQMEEQIIQEQKDAEQRLASALQALEEENEVLRAIIYFREIDVDNSTHAQVHQQVEKVIDRTAGIGSANQLETEVQKVERILRGIEEALQEVRDAYNKSKKDLQDEKEGEKDLEEISGLINEIEKGATMYQRWAGAPEG